MKKLISFFIGLLISVTAHANTQVPAATVSTTTGAYANCLTSSDTNAQQSLNDLDACFGTHTGGNPGAPYTSFQYNNGGSFAGGNMYQVNGNIGIGSLTPGQKLDIVGTVRATNFIGSLTGTASGNLTANQTITASGDATGSGTTTLPLTLKNTGTAGTYRSTTFDAQGRETSGTNPTTFAGYGLSDTSANLRSALTDSTGTGVAVFGTSPNLTANVGIGSANPGKALDVSGTVRMTGFSMPTGASNTYVLTSDANGVGSWAAGGSGTVNAGTAGQNAYYASSTNAVSGTNDLIFNGTNSYFNQGNVGIGTVSPQSALQVNGNSVFNSPTYAYFNNSTAFVAGAGGTITTYTSGGTTYKVHTFTTGNCSSGCNFTAPNQATNVQVLVIAGGGSGGWNVGGGGGAGGYQYNPSYPTTVGQSITVTVGNGGTSPVSAGQGNAGQNSVFGSITANGGGGGGYYSGGTGTVGSNGGSGGGGGGNDTAVRAGGTGSQGSAGGSSANAGYYGSGGGGGSGGVGSNGSGTSAGKGGDGTSNSITGTAVIYATGGGGSSSAGGTRALGGSSNVNGGQGNVYPDNAQSSGTANTGAGGGGGQTAAGNGGSGVVIVAYVVPSFSQVIATNGAVGIGVTANTNLLDVSGNASIGAGYAGIASAPANGLLVQGNVGIGTINPTALLSVNGVPTSGTVTSSSANQVAYFPSAGTTVQGASSVYTNGTNVGIGTSSLQGALVVTNGNVGIGTWAPNNYALQVNSTANLFELTRAGQNFTVTMGGSGSPGTSGYPIIITNNNTSSDLVLQTQNEFILTGNGNIGIGTSTPQGGLVVTNGNVGIGTWAPSGALIVQGGNVGIGTNSSAYPLYVYSSTAPGKIAYFQGSGGFGSVDLNGNWISNYVSATMGIYQTSTSWGPNYFMENTGIGTALPTSGLSIGNNGVSIGAGYTNGLSAPSGGAIIAGNVGIGTWVPNNKFTLIGNVGISTTNAASIQTGFSGAGVTSCICKQFQSGICTNATCT